MTRFIAMFTLFFMWAANVNAFEEINTGYFNDMALQGYDTSQYFTESKAISGKEEYVVEWKGAKWQFADAKSRDLFAATPDRYAPQYGGYCSNQMSLGNLSDVDPGVWLIHDDKLYFFGHQAGKDRWKRTGIAARIKDANKHWQEYLSRN